MITFSNPFLPCQAALLCLLAIAMPVTADTLVLRDGSQVDGVILHEDATSYTLEVQITKSIKDERTVAKKLVATIVRSDPSQSAFAALAQLTPVPDAQSRDEYTRRIHAVEKFLHDHPATSHVPQAQAILATLQVEASAIAAGAIKLNGLIVNPADYQANQYDLDSLVEMGRVRQLVGKAEVVQALRAFNRMGEDFRNTAAYLELIPQMQQVITSYMNEVGQSLATLDARTKERAQGLERMSATDRRSTELAIRQETAAVEGLFKTETAAKSPWVTIHPFFKPSLDATMVFAKQELARLSAIRSAPVVDAGKSFRDALTVARSHADPAQMPPAIDAATKAMVAPRYLAILQSTAAQATH